MLNGARIQHFLMHYANTGGRVFASHFHYAWFNTGPFTPARTRSRPGTPARSRSTTTRGVPVGRRHDARGGAAFPEGAALNQWLGNVGALTRGQAPHLVRAHNVHARRSCQPPATEWIQLDPAASMPRRRTRRNTSRSTRRSAPRRVGLRPRRLQRPSRERRPGDAERPRRLTRTSRGYPGPRWELGGTVPAGCAAHPLTPQEKALEFMLFDLSSCLVPVGHTVPPVVPPVVR